ncbi:MAG: hypothetical protein ACREJ0_17660, partial [Geminicoccaceae bacterium]
RALRTLKALQAEQAARPAAVSTPQPTIEPVRAHTYRIEVVPGQDPGEDRPAPPIEPERRRNPGESEPAPAVNEPAQHCRGPAPAPASKPVPLPALTLARLQRSPQPNEPRQTIASD